MSDTITLDIDAPDDWHVHLRDDEMLDAVAPFTAEAFRHALIMPNLVPPVTSTALAVAYRDRILAAAGPNARADFTPMMALYLNDQLETADLLAGATDGVVFGAKFYPAGATTNSAAGGTSLLDYRGTLEAMAGAGIPLLVHAESTDPEVDIFDREAVFIEQQMVPVIEQIPELRVTVEHISTRAGLEIVRDHPQVGGSITPHHLTCDRSDLLANGMRPELYCKPVINSREERIAIATAATSGDRSFFFGTDSAPHPLSKKEAATVAAGIFNAPYALEVVAELFHEWGALDKLEAFVSHHGVDHYGLERATTKVRLTRRPDCEGDPAQSVCTAGGAEVRIFGADAARRWTWEPIR
ncbi:MAG: dihydroorotase [Acidimicrobiales bacterium]